MKFEKLNLDHRIQTNIRNAGFETATPIQEKAIPVVLKGGDVLGLAQTGTGKTAAFMLPILQKLAGQPRGKVRALVLAPTRELAEQIYEETRRFSKGTGIRSMTIYGGVSKNPQLSTLKRGVEIVVACPGRLLDHMGEGSIDLSNLDVLVLDEADRMCDMGFLPDIKRIVSKLPKHRQTLFFSATMPDEIKKLANKILNNPADVKIGMTAPAKTVSHALYPVSQSRKKDLLFALLKETATGKVLIFTRTKHKAKNVARLLSKRGFNVSALEGSMSQNGRQNAIKGFRGSKYDMLVATDIAARGIDVSEVTHVINFDMPDTVDAYTHRIGRTGRALNTGDAFTFATPDDKTMVRDIEKVLGKPLERITLSGFDYAERIRQEHDVRKPAAPKTFARKQQFGRGRRSAFAA